MKKISTTVSTASEVDEIFIVSDEVAERFSNMIDEIEEDSYDEEEEMLEAYLFLSENSISSKVEGARTLGDGALYFNDIDISPL